MASDLAVQQEGLSTSAVFKTAGAIAGSLVVIVILLLQWVNLQFQEADAAAADVVAYPEIEDAELQASQLLTQYGVVDAEQGLYRIPIETAMQLMVDQAYANGQIGPADSQLIR